MAQLPKTGPGLHHIAVRARDFEATTRFYEALGFTNAYEWRSGETRLALMDAGDGNYVEVISGETPSSEGALIHFALRTDSADAMYERALNAGATSHIAPKDVLIEGRGPASGESAPVRLAFVKGLNGEIIEFFQNSVL